MSIGLSAILRVKPHQPRLEPGLAACTERNRLPNVPRTRAKKRARWAGLEPLPWGFRVRGADSLPPRCGRICLAGRAGTPALDVSSPQSGLLAPSQRGTSSPPRCGRICLAGRAGIPALDVSSPQSGLPAPRDAGASASRAGLEPLPWGFQVRRADFLLPAMWAHLPRGQGWNPCPGCIKSAERTSCSPPQRGTSRPLRRERQHPPHLPPAP